MAVRSSGLTQCFQVAAVFICFLILLVRVSPDWGATFLGFIPSKGLFQTQPDALYTGKWRDLSFYC